MSIVLASVMCLLLRRASSPKVLGVDGKHHQPWSEAAGKPVVFIFISHDCPVCNAYGPEIGRIEAAFKGRMNFDIVYSEERLTKEQARAHAKEFAIGHALLLLDPDREFAKYCNAAVTPQAILYDSGAKKVYSGRIDDRYYALGQLRPMPTSHDLIQAINAVLAHQTPKPASGPPIGCFITLPHKT